MACSSAPVKESRADCELNTRRGGVAVLQKGAGRASGYLRGSLRQAEELQRSRSAQAAGQVAAVDGRAGTLARPPAAGGQDRVDLRRTREQLLAPRARRTEGGVHRLDQARLHVAVAGRSGTAGAHPLVPLRDLARAQEELEEAQQEDARGILGLLRRAAVGHDAPDRLPDGFPLLQYPDRVALTVAHLLAVDARY